MAARKPVPQPDPEVKPEVLNGSKMLELSPTEREILVQLLANAQVREANVKVLVGQLQAKVESL